MGKYNHCFIKPRYEKSVIYHEDKETPSYPIFFDKKLFPEANMWITVRRIPKCKKEEVIDKFKAATIPHTHIAPEIYIVDGKDGAAKFKWTLDNETYYTETPCTVYIPAGVVHDIEPLEVNDQVNVVAIVLKGEYP